MTLNIDWSRFPRKVTLAGTRWVTIHTLNLVFSPAGVLITVYYPIHWLIGESIVMRNTVAASLTLDKS